MSNLAQNKAEVSIIIPTYNESENIIQILKSIGEHIPKDIATEAIVVDDNSPDGTGKIVEDYINDNNVVPILNGKNLKIGKVNYEPISGYWIDINKKTKLRKFFDKPHIVLGLGFRGDGQIGAAYDYKSYPWMGDVYHLLRKNTLINNNFNLTEEEVVNFLNSEIVKRYVKDIFRDITYHFSITQLKLVPLPLKEELKVLKETLWQLEIGKKILITLILLLKV